MNIPPTKPLHQRYYLAGLFCLLFPGPFALAQEVPDNGAKEEVFELSPFEVNTDGDVGYLAGNTLSGSRMNTRLKDTAASISVFTPEFLSDLGATSTAETIRYGTNSNPDYQQGSSSPTLAFLDAGLYSDTRINIRGILASRTIDFFETSIPTDYYNLDRSDLSSGPNSILFGFANAGGLFNSSTKDAEFRKNITTVELQAGSWDWLRTTFDSNIVAIEDQLAVRLMGVWMESNNWRSWDFKDTQRGTLAVQYKPTETIRLRASYERAKMQNSAQKPFGYVDGYSGYFTGTSAGQPLDVSGNVWAESKPDGYAGIGPVTIYFPGSNLLASNTSALGTYYRQTMPVWRGFGFDSDGEPVPAYRWDGIGSIFNNTVVPDSEENLFGIQHVPNKYGSGGPDAKRETDFDRLLLRAEKRFGDNTTLELAYNYEDSNGFAWVPNENTMRYDAFAFIPDPNDISQVIPNPNYGSFYVENGWWGNKEGIERHVLRGTLSHILDLDKWGYHRLAGFFEFSEEDTFTIGGPLAYFDENRAALDSVARNQQRPDLWRNTVRVRSYFDTDNFSTYHAGPIPWELPVLANDGRQYTPRWVTAGPDGSTQVRRFVREIDSYMLADQSYFFEDKLVVTLGLRFDDIQFDEYVVDRVTAGDPEVESGAYVVDERIIRDEVDSSTGFTAKTYTAGLVYHLTDRISLFYNEASNKGPSQLSRILLPSAFNADGTPANNGELPPLSDGSGRDFGVMFDLMEGKVFARLTYFETAQENETSIRAGQVYGINNFSLLEKLRFPEDSNGISITDGSGENPDIISREEYDTWLLDSPGDLLSDTESSGFELEVKLNLMKGWSTTVGYSYTDLERKNIFPRFEPWFERAENFYSRFYDGFDIGDTRYYLTEDGALTTDADANAMERRVRDMQLSTENIRNVEAFGFNNRPHKFNVFTRYQIQDGPLEKLFFGGGVRWQSANKIQRELLGQNEDGTDLLGDRILRGNEIFQTDLFIGYVIDHINFLGISGGWLRIQFNVYNVFDNDDLNIIRYSRAENPDARDLHWKVAPQTPRQYRLSMSLSF